jgi:hypothetical protein
MPWPSYIQQAYLSNPEVSLAEPCVISRNDVVMISIEFLSASIPVKTATRRADYVCLTIMANVSNVLSHVRSRRINPIRILQKITNMTPKTMVGVRRLTSLQIQTEAVPPQ